MTMGQPAPRARARTPLRPPSRLPTTTMQPQPWPLGINTTAPPEARRLTQETQTQTDSEFMLSPTQPSARPCCTGYCADGAMAF